MSNTLNIDDIVKNYSSVGLSFLPTPLHKMQNLSEKFGVNLYCKRDDLTGFAFGGNKTRKLDYLMSDALSEGVDCLVTFGSNQSNWCRMASAAGSYMGLDVHMLLDGQAPESPSGNLILDKLVGAKIEYINNPDPDVIVDAALSKAEELRKNGRNPYYLPVGGSTPIGTLGYINAFNEICKDSIQTGIKYDKIFVATGSAGTQAGLVCGQILEGWKGDIIGISVGRDKMEQEKMIISLVEETFDMLGIEIEQVEIQGRVTVDDDYFGEGYRLNTIEAGEAIALFASNEGIFLDEVYTGKAAAGLIDYARNGKLRDSENILFIHTGGGIQLFE